MGERGRRSLPTTSCKVRGRWRTISSEDLEAVVTFLDQSVTLHRMVPAPSFGIC